MAEHMEKIEVHEHLHSGSMQGELKKSDEVKGQNDVRFQIACENDRVVRCFVSLTNPFGKLILEVL
jgi:hypothetical protein